MGLLASSVSNSADIEDVEDDIQNGIYTIPARFGVLPTRALSAGLFLGSVYKSGIIPHAIPLRQQLSKASSPYRSSRISSVSCMSFIEDLAERMFH